MGKESITVYVDSGRKQELEARADERDETLSTYCQGVLNRHLQGEAFEEKTAELDAERRLEELVALARDEMEAAAQDIRETQQTAALHCVANWELLKTDFGPVHRNEAMTKATSRLREDLVKAGIDPDALDDADTQDPESTASDPAAGSEQTPASDQADSDGSDTETEGSDWKTWMDDDEANDDDSTDDSDDDDDVYIDRDWDI